MTLIGAFDHPAAIRPLVQHDLAARLPWFADLPVRTPSEAAKTEGYHASIVSRQYPEREM